LGIDPAIDRAKARGEAAATKLTLAVVSERYLEARKVALRPATLRAAVYHFNALWKPLRNRPIADIERATRKAWRIQYRVNRQQCSESLGDIRKVSLDDARTSVPANR
jgi:hypothetical protein